MTRSMRVIPAQAGIQKRFRSAWIPVFTGMTTTGDRAPSEEFLSPRT